MNPITIHALVAASLEKTWECYTLPEHITQWNQAIDTWHCPSASNDLVVGGRYVARMEAKDGSFGFDYEATYTEVVPMERFTYTLTDGRAVQVAFEEVGQSTRVTVTFDPETENPIELQQQGWQAILDSFKRYTEQ
jgi:uncharacterized protein YndB with AHSA1/START domain